MTETMSKYSQAVLPFVLEELSENAPVSKTAQDLSQDLQDRGDDIQTQEESMYRISTIRNKELITEKEQDKLRNTVVAFFGLSVGSHAALTWMMQSRSNCIKIADPDEISPSNLNRLRFGWDNVGLPKVEVVERELKSINPFVEVVSLKSRDKERMVALVNNDNTHIIVDAIDDIEGKILIRKLAKQLGIPVLMATDVGDNVLLDIERYDLNPDEEPFLGRVPGIESIDISALSNTERRQIAITVVGLDHNSERMIQSIASIGISIKTWPQLAATATIAGGVITTAIKKIVLGENVKSGRYVISLDEILVADFNTEDRVRERNQLITQLLSR